MAPSIQMGYAPQGWYDDNLPCIFGLEYTFPLGAVLPQLNEENRTTWDSFGKAFSGYFKQEYGKSLPEIDVWLEDSDAVRKDTNGRYMVGIIQKQLWVLNKRYNSEVFEHRLKIIKAIQLSWMLARKDVTFPMFERLVFSTGLSSASYNHWKLDVDPKKADLQDSNEQKDLSDRVLQVNADVGKAVRKAKATFEDAQKKLKTLQDQIKQGADLFKYVVIGGVVVVVGVAGIYTYLEVKRVKKGLAE